MLDNKYKPLKYTEAIFSLSAPFANEYQGANGRMLFVCSAGMLRSPTAANVANSMGFNARSCGSHSNYALIPLSANLIYWAQNIFFVNEENSSKAQEIFKNHPGTLEEMQSKMQVWNIPDEYEYMHPTLVQIVTERLNIYKQS